MSRPKAPDTKHLKYYKVLSANLKHYRSTLKETQEQISEKANISSKYLSLLESSATPDYTLSLHDALPISLFCIADALKVEPYQLFELRIK